MFSYFDNLSNFLMDIGREYPRIKEIGSLYPSERLRNASCDYLACIVRLCKHVVDNIRKSGKSASYTSSNSFSFSAIA